MKKMISIIILLSIIQLLLSKTTETDNFHNLKQKIISSIDPQLNLESDYSFDENEDKDVLDGIRIDKDLVIDGQYHIIDALKKVKIFRIYGAKVILKNIYFFYGFSEDYGGAIQLINSSLEIINCHFSNNIASLKGGAINLNNSELHIKQCKFHANKATGLYSIGGGISSENSIIDIEESSFYENSADEGGAIHTINTTLKIFTSNFTNNYANWYGGAILTDSLLLIYNSRFKKNKAEYKGGAIHISLYNYDYNSSLYIDKTHMSENNAEYGGAISSSINDYVHIYNSELINNNASFGAVISRMSSNNIEMANCLCSGNKANYGGILYSMAGGDNTFINSNFKNNNANIGGLIYSISGRISSKETNYDSKFIKCNLLDNNGKKGLIYSIYDDLIINSSNITSLSKSYNVPIIYKIKGGKVIENNNWWGEENPDLTKLIIYEYESATFNNNNKFLSNKLIQDGCCSTFIQIDDNNAAFTFRRDSSTPCNVNIVYQSMGILQYKNDDEYFWHAIITKEGWLVGNGGIDTPYSSEMLEACAKTMIKKNQIMSEIIDKVAKIKSLYERGHFLIKSPNGDYALVTHIVDEKSIKIERGKINPGEYIISPNDYKYYKKGKVSDLNINENNTYISRYLAAIDQYSSARTNDFTYNYITNGKTKYVDIFVANDDGSLAKKKDASKLFNDITIKDNYILGEKVPKIMNGMFLDRYMIQDGGKDSKSTKLGIYLNLLLLLMLFLV